MTTNMYHYTECGLDDVWLAGGYEFVDLPSGRHIKIQDIEGLHREIGKYLISRKKDLTGKEIKFLRKEMLLSQSALSKLFEVTEQTVHRWENGKADIAKPAEALIRLLYKESLHDGTGLKIKEKLQRLADLEDAIDGHKMKFKRPKNEWQLELPLAA